MISKIDAIDKKVYNMNFCPSLFIEISVSRKWAAMYMCKMDGIQFVYSSTRSLLDIGNVPTEW
jgi:hypothetical protein